MTASQEGGNKEYSTITKVVTPFFVPRPVIIIASKTITISSEVTEGYGDGKNGNGYGIPMYLSTPPSEDVIVHCASLYPFIADCSDSTLTFTSANWHGMNYFL